MLQYSLPAEGQWSASSQPNGPDWKWVSKIAGPIFFQQVASGSQSQSLGVATIRRILHLGQYIANNHGGQYSEKDLWTFDDMNGDCVKWDWCISIIINISRFPLGRSGPFEDRLDPDLTNLTCPSFSCTLYKPADCPVTEKYGVWWWGCHIMRILLLG